MNSHRPERSRDMRLPHPCAEAGCGKIVHDATRHCDAHETTQETQEASHLADALAIAIPWAVARPGAGIIRRSPRRIRESRAETPLIPTVLRRPAARRHIGGGSGSKRRQHRQRNQRQHKGNHRFHGIHYPSTRRAPLPRGSRRRPPWCTARWSRSTDAPTTWQPPADCDCHGRPALRSDVSARERSKLRQRAGNQHPDIISCQVPPDRAGKQPALAALADKERQVVADRHHPLFATLPVDQ